MARKRAGRTGSTRSRSARARRGDAAAGGHETDMGTSGRSVRDRMRYKPGTGVRKSGNPTPRPGSASRVLPSPLGAHLTSTPEMPSFLAFRCFRHGPGASATEKMASAARKMASAAGARWNASRGSEPFPVVTGFLRRGGSTPERGGSTPERGGSTGSVLIRTGTLQIRTATVPERGHGPCGARELSHGACPTRTLALSPRTR